MHTKFKDILDNIKIKERISPNAVADYFKKLELEIPLENEKVELAFLVLEHTDSQTIYTTISCAGLWIEKFATGHDVDRLKAVRSKLPALSGLRDYRVDFDLYIDLLQAKKDGNCSCNQYASANTPAYHEQFTVIESKVDQENYCTNYLVTCKRCGAKYKVTQEEGYHYPISRWSSC